MGKVRDCGVPAGLKQRERISLPSDEWRKNRVLRQARNFAIAYAFLVGLPVLGIVAILNVAHNISAPPSVDGVWKIEIESRSAAPPPCLSLISNTLMVISQSGKSLNFHLNGSPAASATGRIEGTVIQASFPEGEWTKQRECRGFSMWTIRAEVSSERDPKTLAGTLSLSGDAMYSPIRWRAIQQISGRKGSE